MLRRTALVLLLMTGSLTLAAEPLVIGETFTIESKVLGEVRRINVYRPAGGEQRLPVLYMPDGGIGEDFLHVAGLVQIGAANGTMRPHLLVGIENTERRRDLTGPTENAEDKKIATRVGGSAAFRAFLREELIPEIEKRYRTDGRRAIIGESLAGLFVVETLLTEPELFDTYIAFDPSLWWNDGALVSGAAARLAELKPSPRVVYLATSSEEGIAKRVDAFASAVSGTSWLTVRRERMPQETHATIYHPAALAALRGLFAP